MMTKAEATKRAAALKRRVKGKGWTVIIHENLGWHFCLHLGGLSLYEHRSMFDKPSYSTLLSDMGGHGGGAQQFYTRQHFKDPNQAVRNQLVLARRWTDNVNKIVEAVEDGFGGTGWRARPVPIGKKGLASKPRSKRHRPTKRNKLTTYL